MQTSLFDYDLPDGLIAQRPLPARDGARMLVVERGADRHAMFTEFPDVVPEGALVVLNDTRVRKARLVGARRGTGGRVEILLLGRIDGGGDSPETWAALGRANRSLKPGTILEAGSATILIRSRDEQGLLGVSIFAPEGVEKAIERHGHVPLPPYIKRPDSPEDADRYQTVFSERVGSSAAPTAGLHFTPEIMDRLRRRGVDLGFVTLHVGLGTFRPVSSADLDAHPMHVEEYEVSVELAEKVRACRARSGCLVAVGTTVVRALESARDPSDPRFVASARGKTNLLIQPGYRFGPVDGLLTNFHMPRSTLIALVAAFAGRERILSAYRAAAEAGYRFLSYGDAMWIPERLEVH